MAIETEMMEWMRERLGVAGLAADRALAEIPGWDSLRHAQFIIELQRRFKVRFSVSELLSIVSVSQAADLIRAKTAAGITRT